MKAISRGWPDMDFLKDCTYEKRKRGEVGLVESGRWRNRMGGGEFGVCEA